MTDRAVRVIILCEDRQQSCFIRRFLVEKGFERRKIREKISPAGRGSGFDYVLKEYPKELSSHRSMSYDSSILLVICIDADSNTISERERQLDDECEKNSIEKRRSGEKVLFVIPKRNIETWFAFLRGEDVNEETEYKKYDCESDCQSDVKALIKCCEENKFNKPAPSSLSQACSEYKLLM
jgi:hypothetical protein